MDSSAAEQRQTPGTVSWPRPTRRTAKTPATRQTPLDEFDGAELDLPQVFTPAQAAKILRSLGLTEITECALRTRAYRKQVPFHLNGRRIMFTIGDLREIAEGEARPRAASAEVPASTDLPAPEGYRRSGRKRSATRRGNAQPGAWRARRPGLPAVAAIETP